MSGSPTSSGTSGQEEFRPPFWQRDWLWGFLLIAFVFVAYACVFNAGFIWDDEAHLTENPCIVGPLGLKEIWSSARAVYYPLVLTTFWIWHKFVGLNPTPYHILNVLMHAGSTVLLWRVFRELDVRGAWLGAAFWGLHPVMVQSVAWVTELKNTQSCLFYLLSILCFLKWQGQPQITRVRTHWWRFLLSVLFFVLAILSKPSVVMMPAVLALCTWWRRKRVRWRDVLALVPFMLVSAVAAAWTIWEQKFHAGASGPEWAQSWLERLIIASRAIWFYLGKLIWPNPLIFIYPRWEINSSRFVTYLPLVAGLAVLIVLCLCRWKWKRPVFFAVAYFVISLFPVLGFFSVYFFRYSFVSDHFQYLASMGPLALAGAGITAGCSRLAQSRRAAVLVPTRRQSAVATTTLRPFTIGWQSLLQPTVCGIILLVLGAMTWWQSRIYNDVVTLYQKTLRRNPGCWMAHYNLGIALRNRGQNDQAIYHYREAVTIRPAYAEAHYNLARLLVEKGEFEDAIAHYEKALTINPDSAETHNNLGNVLLRVGRTNEAIDHYRRALEVQPDYAEAFCNLAEVLLSQGDMDGAIVNYLAGLTLSPNHAEAQYNLASALLRKGRTDEAIAHYRKTLELRPGNADAHANLGSALLEKGRVQEAIFQYKAALELAPENIAAQSNLAWLLATCSDPSLRNGPEAVLLAEKADRLSGGNQPLILRALAAAYAETGRFADAIETAQQALRLAAAQDNTVLVNALRKELVLYQFRLPYHKERG